MATTLKSLRFHGQRRKVWGSRNSLWRLIWTSRSSLFELDLGLESLDNGGFQSTEFLTPPLSTKQASQLVLVVPEYGRFKGALVAEGIRRFTGRVMSIQFGREGSPVLYVQLPYWTHQREGPITHQMGTRIPDEEHKRLVEELRKVFVDELSAEEFGPDTIDKRRIRIWWHH